MFCLIIPMATSLGFGVIFGSAISLILVPSAYMILEDLRLFFSRKRVAPAVAGQLHVVESPVAEHQARR